MKKGYCLQCGTPAEQDDQGDWIHENRMWKANDHAARVAPTPEMIEAVHAHDAEVKRVKDEADRRESLRRYQEQQARFEERLRTEVRTVWPEATDEQVDDLYGIVSKFVWEEM